MDFTDKRKKHFLKKAVVTRYVKKKKYRKCNSIIVFFFQDVVTYFDRNDFRFCLSSSSVEVDWLSFTTWSTVPRCDWFIFNSCDWTWESTSSKMHQSQLLKTNQSQRSRMLYKTTFNQFLNVWRKRCVRQTLLIYCGNISWSIKCLISSSDTHWIIICCRCFHLTLLFFNHNRL